MGEALIFHDLTFSYDTGGQALFEGLNAHFPRGWTGVVGPNGAGKSTLLKLASGLLCPQLGVVDAPEGALYCPQRTDSVPDGFDRFLGSSTGTARELSGKLSIEPDWIGRWDTLSHGERKRAQIAVALWRKPGVLAVDEPTNHLDSLARACVMAALEHYEHIGLLVSHDRKLLDTLCLQCLFLDPPEVITRPGGYSEGSEQARLEREHARDRYRKAKQNMKQLRTEAARRREKASRADRMRSKRGLGRRDSDAREKIDRARVTGKDGVHGKLLNQLEGRLHRQEREVARFAVKKVHKTGFWISGSRSEREHLFYAAPGELSLGSENRLIHPEIVIRRTDRISLSGPNGGGKSTLIRFIVESIDLPEERLIYLPQEIDARRAREILDHARRLPRGELGHMMTVVSGLGTRPERLLGSDAPSPGETRKLLLAIGVARRPHLIIMDEPTNHLDLPSIELLEKALVACPCGLLLVSHDGRFLQATTSKRWSIAPKEEGDQVLRIVA